MFILILLCKAQHIRAFHSSNEDYGETCVLKNALWSLYENESLIYNGRNALEECFCG